MNGLDKGIRTTKPDEWRYCCPFCITKIGKQDTKAHLYANFKKNQFFCFRCLSKGTIGLLKKYINLKQSGGIESKPDLQTLKNKINSLYKKKVAAPHELDLYSWPIMSGKAPLAYEYMKNRGFSDEEMLKYDLRVGRTFTNPVTNIPDRRWSGRVIFPFYEDTKLVFCVARSYTGKEPKYINSVGNKDRVIYGIDSVQTECIICEGIVSAIAANRKLGVPAVSMLGKTISDYQISKLRSKCSKVYVALDGTDDVTERQRSMLNRALLKAGFKVWELRLPHDKDPDDATPEELKTVFAQARKVGIV